MERTFETPTPPRLDLRLPSGAIEVDAVETDRTEIRLDGPDDLLERATVEQRGDTILVDVPSRKGFFLGWSGPELRLVVRCPADARLAARTKSADVTVRGPLASADVASASGDVELDTVARGAEVKTASGDVEIRETGSLVANTASGDVSVRIVHGTLKVNAVSGDVQIDSAGGDADVSSVSGDATLRAVHHGSVRVNAVSGDVEVGIRRGSRVHVDASTLSGDTHSDLELGGDAAAGDGPVVELRVKTVSGDISVVRAPAPEPQEVQ